METTTNVLSDAAREARAAMRETHYARTAQDVKCEKRKEKEVYFPVCDVVNMRIYCQTHHITVPTLYAEQIHGGDYYRAPYSVWEQLYRNLPYNVWGCYDL